MKLLADGVLWMALCCFAGASAMAQSLYREDTWRSLTGDHKAFRPGDVITVQVLENTSAVSSADTGTRRNNHLQAQLGHGATTVAQSAISVTGEFDGGGRTQRASRLLATVSVTVQEVMASGQLRIGGAQSITVNGEAQTVSIEGLVRPGDISEGNLVQSTRVADARITYVGEGDVTERGRRSWWRRVVDAVGF